MPDICKLAFRISAMWINASFLGDHNVIIKEALSWLLQNHSCMIALSQSKNPLIMMTRYWVDADSSDSALHKRALELVGKYPKDSTILLNIPPSLEQFDEKTAFAMLLLSIMIKPSKIQESMRFYGGLLADTIGTTFEELSKVATPTIAEANPGIIHVKTGSDSYKEMLEDLQEQLKEPVRALLKITSVDPDSLEEVPTSLIGVPLFQLYCAARSSLQPLVDYA